MSDKTKVLVIGTSGKGGMASVIENHFSNGLYDNRKVQLIVSNVNGTIFKRLYFAMSAFFKIIVFLVDRDPVIVHMHGSERGSIYRKALYLMLVKIFGKKATFHSHGAEFKHFYEVNSSVYKFLVRFILEQSDAIFVLSNYWKDYMQSIANPKVVEVINNFPTRAYEEYFNQRDFYTPQKLKLLYLGEVGARKGIYDLVDAVEILVKRNVTGFVIKVAGKGEIDKLQQLLSSKELTQWFEILGWVSGEQKDQVIFESDILVLPSYNEGLPIAILEAFSAGLPVISTPVGGIPDAIESGRNGLLVSPGQPQQLAKAIEHCINHRDDLESYANNARKLYESEYSAQVNIKRIDKVYSKLLAR